jgi:hypothetical protein
VVDPDFSHGKKVPVMVVTKPTAAIAAPTALRTRIV